MINNTPLSSSASPHPISQQSTNARDQERNQTRLSASQELTLNRSQAVGNQILLSSFNPYEEVYRHVPSESPGVESQIEGQVDSKKEIESQASTGKIYETSQVYGETSQVYGTNKSCYSSNAPGMIQEANVGLTSQQMIHELAVEVKKSSELLQASLPTIHIPEEIPEEAGRTYRNLTAQLKQELNDSYLSVMEYIKDLGPALMQMAEGNQADQVVEVKGKQILFTQKGKVFVATKELGKGQFKITNEMALVASTKMESLKEQMEVYAFGLAKPNTNVNTARWEKEERDLNLYIKAQSKQGHDLPHVHLVKRIVDVNIDQVGILSEARTGNIEQMVKSENLELVDKLPIATQMAQGLEELHSIGVVHRDLKLDNFLYTINANKEVLVKISDFGLSSRQDMAHRSTNKKEVTWHIDPAWNEQPTSAEVRFSKESDVYQLGISFCQLLSSKNYGVYQWVGVQIAESKEMREAEDSRSPPQNSETPKQMEERARQLWKANPDKWKVFAEIPDEAVRQMVRRMVDPDPAKRPSISEVVVFFKSRSGSDQ